jgi:hypothetical protein
MRSLLRSPSPLTFPCPAPAAAAAAHRASKGSAIAVCPRPRLMAGRPTHRLLMAGHPASSDNCGKRKKVQTCSAASVSFDMAEILPMSAVSVSARFRHSDATLNLEVCSYALTTHDLSQVKFKFGNGI